LFLPIAYTVLEFIKFEAYPWTVAVTQADNPHWAQIVEIVGVAGLSGLLALINVGAWRVWERVFGHQRNSIWTDCGASLAAVLLILGYGHVRLAQVREAECQAPVLDVAAIQPNTPGKVLNDDAETKRRICDTLYSLARESVQNCSPDIIVFAESSAPMAFQYGGNPEFKEIYKRIAQDFGVPLLVDNVHYIDREEFYRAALLLSVDGEILGEYKKRVLVPFGEYIPFVKQFPFLKKLFRYLKTYHRGTDYPVLMINGVQLAPQICFEIIHPGPVRNYIRRGGQVLINMSNDSWYADRKETTQHFALGRFRCIENRVPMVRVTNTGISGYVSATGEIVGEISPIDQIWTDCQPVPITDLNSPYRRHGDWFEWSCTLALVGFAAADFLKRLHSRQR